MIATTNTVAAELGALSGNFDAEFGSAPAQGAGQLQPDFIKARAFLAALGTNHTYQTFDDTKGRKLPGLVRVINAADDDATLTSLADLNTKGAGIFVTVNQTDGKWRKAENIIAGRAIYADFDGDNAVALFEAAAVKLPPSIVIESSPGKRHAYWLCACDKKALEAVQAKMPEAVGCDPGAKDTARVLRVPGFFHRKGDPMLVKLLECHPDRRYELCEIVAAFGLDRIEGKAKADRPTTGRADALAGADYDPLDCVINEHDDTLLHSALRHVSQDGKRTFDPTSRADWVEVGLDLAPSGDVGFKLFHEWAAEAGSEGGYKGDDDCRERFFNDFAVRSKSRYPNIFAKASSAGWVQRVAGFPLDDVPEHVPAPEKHSKALPWPPGLVGEVASYIQNSSRMPVPSFAIAGALSVISYMIRNFGYVKPSDTPLNLYQVLIGGTGKGKEDPRKAIKRILKEMDDHDLIEQLTENMSSGTALLRSLSGERAPPNLMMMSDEYGIFMQAAMTGKDEHRRDLVKELMSLYGLARSFHGGKRYARSADNIGRIDFPYVVTLGTTTEEELFAGLNMTAINNGSVNRNIYVYADADVKPNRRPDIKVPQALIDKLKALFGDFALSQIQAMEYAADAEELIVEFADNIPTTGKFANLWSRAEESAIRVAGVLAYCDGKIIKVEHVRWAIDYVRASIKAFDARSETQISESFFDKQMNKMLEIIRNPRRYTDDIKFRTFTSKGKMPRGKLLNLMKTKARDLDDIIEALLLSEQIKTGKEDETTVFWV